ncbi:MAG TPA: hypothetical protein VMH33_07650 [Solirubrobacterales bacterium]|nr:hypothetical protein [Solirubrobacterales bacterium]
MPEPTPMPEPTDVLVDRELQRVVGEARQELNAAVVIVAELRASADGFAERISATSARLDQFEGWLAAAEAPAPVAVPPQAPNVQAPPAVAPQMPPEPIFAPAAPVPPVYEGADQFATEAAVPAAPITRTVSLTVAGLSNLTVVSVVEAALLRIPGVREVALRQLQGRKAILEIRLDEGTGLISGLRKSLPIAFDVTDSSDHSLEIALSYAGAQPQTTNGGGGAGSTLA